MATQRCLYQLRGRYINTTLARTFHQSQFYNQKEEEEKKTDQPKRKTFSETFKSELDDETKKKIEETLKYINENTGPIRSILQKFKKLQPEKDTQNEPIKPSKIKLMYSKVDEMKERLSGENLTKMSAELKEKVKLKSTSILESIEEMKKREKKVENVEKVEKVSIAKKVADFAERSGLDTNPLYKKAQDLGSDTSAFVKDQQNSMSKMYKKSMDRTSGILETFKMSKEVKDDLVKKSGEMLDEVSKTRDQISLSAKEVADKLQKEKDEITSSDTFQKVAETTSSTLKTAAAELIDETRLRESEIYRSPEILKKRIEEKKDPETKENTMKADEKTTGVVFHKESMWESNWNNFKNNNPMANQFLEYRTKFEESDNIVLRATRVITDGVMDVVRGMTQPTDISLTVAEVCKLDKTFNLTEFCTTLRFEIVPHVLEAFLKKDLVILKDWSHERAFGQFEHMIKSRSHKGKINLIDIGECDIKLGKMMEQGPVFIFSVQTQQVYTNFDKAGEITDENIKLITYLIAVCRDQTMFDHRAAWLVLEIHEHVQSDGYI